MNRQDNRHNQLKKWDEIPVITASFIAIVNHKREEIIRDETEQLLKL